jgi:hypothetical protein
VAPSVIPVTTHDCAPVGGVDVSATVQATVAPDDVPVTVYSVATPSAMNETDALSAPTFVAAGVDSATPGVYVFECADTVAVVALPLGVTVNVYATPLVRPVTVHDCAPVGGLAVLVSVHVCVPGVEAPAAYVLITYVVATPSAVNEIVAAPLPAPTTPVSTMGVSVVIGEDALDVAVPFVLPLVVTLNV